MRDAPSPGPVRRITVRWDAGGWTVTSQTRVDAMTLPRSDDLGGRDALTPTRGFWFELVDGQGTVLYRQVMEHPLLPHELFDDEGEPYREGEGGGEAEFEILVPEAPGMEEVRFISDQRPGPKGELVTTDRAEVVGAIPVSARDQERKDRDVRDDGGEGGAG